MEPKRIFDVMAIQASTRPITDALAAKVNGAWRPYSSQDVTQTADTVTRGLRSLGIEKGQAVAIISMNRPEWAMVDLGCLQLGAVTVPLYPTATPQDYEYILQHSEARAVFVSTREIWERVTAIRSRLPNLVEIYTFDQVTGASSWDAVIEKGRAAASLDLGPIKAAVKGEDVASLIYTSGTTGTPKGVMLTHNNILANMMTVAKILPLHGVRRALSFLPLSHVLERTVSYYYQWLGISIYYAESIDTIAKNLSEVSPGVFATVPRLLEKIYGNILAKGHQLTGIKKKLFDWAINLGLNHDPDHPLDLASRIQLALARKLIFSKWQAALGGNLNVVVIGGSALQPRLGRIFWAAGIHVVEGYGLTETSPVIACNTVDHHRIGTVGRVLPNLKVKIAPEPDHGNGVGEILVQGPSVTQGYYKNPEATKEAIDAEGWFHTGDIGTFQEGQYLRITDRKKEMFKTSGGKYVAPLAVESKFRESALISQIMVVGENQKFPAALIVPDGPGLEAWALEQGIKHQNLAELVRHKKVRDLFGNEVSAMNKNFGQWEQVKQFRLVAEEWTIARGELTPKLSMKRKVIMEKHKDLIGEIYRGDGL